MYITIERLDNKYIFTKHVNEEQICIMITLLIKKNYVILGVI